MNDLQAKPPALVVSRWQGGGAPKFDVPMEDLGDLCNCGGEILEGLDAFSQFMKENYERELLFRDTYAVYRRTGS